ncbi:MAG: pyridoxine 5'-phosphate synthase [Dysgonamonadaceae bacterium]|jgi:pyridoxine 5-phosphate synthase|nr:pyridoxine 5'-phosphate synthase [Dysgonamonadaceae bacterium]
MIKLSVNINKIAVLRNARGGNLPDLLTVAQDCETFGAQGITVHPRPDERHIRYGDVYKLKPLIRTELNIEGYPSPSFIDMVLKVKPNQVTLVPDVPEAITSNAGWDTEKYFDLLNESVDVFTGHGIRTSLFVDTDPVHIERAAKTGTDRVELYTGPYALNYAANKETAIAPFVQAATLAKKLGMGVNAGHDLSLENLRFLASKINWLEEVSIGHALICDALYYGLEKTIGLYKAFLSN